MKTDSLGFSLSDILFLIGMQARTGELVLESGNNIGTMVFHKGTILQAFSPYSRAIGDLLVEGGLIDEEELMESLMRQKRSAYAPLGSLLKKKGKVTLQVIEVMVHEQIRQAMKEFQSWKGLKVNFVNKNIKTYDDIRLDVHEFIPPKMLKAAGEFLSLAADARPGKRPAPSGAPSSLS
jgi:Domain of unknown function (DUF4388)